MLFESVCSLPAVASQPYYGCFLVNVLHNAHKAVPETIGDQNTVILTQFIGFHTQRLPPGVLSVKPPATCYYVGEYAKMVFVKSSVDDTPKGK